jgi:hypothetical protein
MTYVNIFNTLSKYAPKEVATDAKKREWFYDGLLEELQDKLSTTKFDDFNDLMNIAIRAEHEMKKLEAKNKCPLLPRRVVAPHVWGHLLLHLTDRVLNLHALCGLCATLNLLKDKLQGWPMPFGATQVFPQGVHATIMVPRATYPRIAPLQDKVVPLMHLGPATLHLKHHIKEPSHNKLLSVAASTTPSRKKFRRMLKWSWVHFS